MSFDLTFEGYGIVNGIRYKDNGTGIFLTNPVDGNVYQKGVIELKTDSDTIETTYESISRKHDNGIVLDNGIMIFNTPSSKGGELSFLNNIVAAYKDMIDLKKRQSNYYSMGMEIELILTNTVTIQTNLI